MFDFHKDKPRYFQIQYKTSAEYIIPFIEGFVDTERELNVLEIGCAEAGVLKAFTEKGHQCVGIELQETRVELAKGFMDEELKAGKIQFIARNIYDIDPNEFPKFDLIILKDVIEHIPEQEVFMSKIGEFMATDGKIFFGFPPWQMPFGGHQQICKSKLLSFLPYFHLLPMSLFKGLMKIMGESEGTRIAMIEIKETGISMERFERILKKESFQITKHQLFFINPIYKYKFGLKVRKQLSIISKIPYLRNFVSTCAYYLVSKNESV